MKTIKNNTSNLLLISSILIHSINSIYYINYIKTVNRAIVNDLQEVYSKLFFISLFSIILFILSIVKRNKWEYRWILYLIFSLFILSHLFFTPLYTLEILFNGWTPGFGDM
jgi:hypothetical protein